MAQDGLAHAIRPAHTLFDDDMIFSLSVGDEQTDTITVGAIAAELVAEAIVGGAGVMLWCKIQ
jgi:L-aminopeptidase/D-esterase-like protein